MESIIGPLIDNSVKPVCSFAKKHISYVFCESKLVKDLGDELKKLEGVKADIETCVDGARGKGQTIFPRVENWLQQAGTRIEEVEQFLDPEKTISDNRSGFNRCFCSICNHYKTGKEATNMLNILKGKLEESREPWLTAVGTSPPPSPPAPMALPPTAYSNEYASRESLLEKIIEALKVKNMIGIYGMAGVGKTVLVERLAAEVESRHLFDTVVIAVVSRPPDPAAIRNVIADRILPGRLQACSSEEGKKDKFHKDLETLICQKKVLLILDDAWEPLELHKVGIPCPEKFKGFKIVVTSRFQNVCVQMEAEETFEVRVLDRKEAWSLFCRSLGRFSEILDSDAGYKDIAVEMVEHFGGLPLALVTLARALIGQELSAWKDAAYHLRKRCLHEIDGMPEKVIGAVEISLSYLHRRDARAIFFLCCLFPEDYDIELEVLMMYGIGWGLFDNRTLVEAMDGVVAMTDKLKSQSLLLKGDRKTTVKMHDVIRQAAIHIASKGEFGFLVKEHAVPNDVILGEKYAISIASNTSIMEFFRHKDAMKYPNLRILRLHGTRGRYDRDRLPHEFSTCFFEEMGNLKLLEMLNLKISSFPTSHGSLKRNLRVVCLRNCTVDDITEVGELTNLEILNLVGSTIHGGLHGAVQRLTRLRMLDLRFCLVNDFFDNVVRGLPKLERLYMLGMKKIDCGKLISTRVVGLETLTQLKVLQLQVERLEELTDNFLSILGNLFSFRICISDKPVYPVFGPSDGELDQHKTLAFKDVTINKYHQQCLDQLLRVVESLFVKSCDGFAPIVLYSGDEYLSNLRQLNLEDCHDVEFVISGPTMKTNDQLAPFGKLEELYLQGLTGLTAICAPSQLVDLSKLRILNIHRCHILSYVFTKSVARQLTKLASIVIKSSCGMEEILAADDNNNNNNNRSGNLSSSEIMDDANSLVLPSLQHLQFFYLPEIKVFAATNRSHGPPSAFFGEQVQLPGLRELTMHILPSCGKIWESQIPKGSFCQLRSLRIESCRELRYIFSAAVARGLPQLQLLKISDCDKLEEVLVIENGNGDGQEKEENKITFPRLHTIALRALESLHSFCSARICVLEFPSLETVVVTCDNMQRFSNGSLYTPKLNHVSGRGGKIWKGDLNTTVFHLYEERRKSRESRMAFSLITEEREEEEDKAHS